MKLSTKKYDHLINSIGNRINHARVNAIQIINKELVFANWEIGKYIVEFEQQGNLKAEYGTKFLYQNIKLIYQIKNNYKQK